MSSAWFNYSLESDLTIRAGIPATTVLSGTSFETTAPEATTEFSPIVTPGKIVAAAPIHAIGPALCPLPDNFP